MKITEPFQVVWSSPEIKEYYDYLGVEIAKAFQLPAYVFDPAWYRRA